jgi:hypothetical protein
MQIVRQAAEEPATPPHRKPKLRRNVGSIVTNAIRGGIQWLLQVPLAKNGNSGVTEKEHPC